MKSTEQSSNYDNLEEMSTTELLYSINQEDQKVALAIKQVLPQVEALVDAAYSRMEKGGRLIYIGSGTSGRLGIVDASECPPTFGVDPGRVVGLIAGGEKAIHKAVEHAEDSTTQGWLDLEAIGIQKIDFVLGITASGTAPYVLGAVETCREQGILTGGLSCNADSALSTKVDFPVEVILGPEFLTGSTRMKAGTAQKLVLNMLSTSLMIKMGHVKGNKMIDMQLSNNKLIDRGTRMIVEETQLPYSDAKELLLEKGSVRKAVDAFLSEKM